MPLSSLIATAIEVVVTHIAEASEIVAGASSITTVAVQGAIVVHFAAALREEALAAARGELSNEEYFELAGFVVGAGVAIAAGVLYGAPIAAAAAALATTMAEASIAADTVFAGLSAAEQAPLIAALGRGLNLALQFAISSVIESGVEKTVEFAAHRFVDLLESAWESSKSEIGGLGNGYIDYARNICTLGYLAKDPLVLDISGTGLAIKALGSDSPYVDLDGNGFATKTAWIGQGSGLLVWMDADGKVHLFTGDSSSGANGFSQLAQLDTSRTGHIDPSNPSFSTLYVWQDVNGDGKVDPGELESLSSLGIASVNLSYSASDIDANGSQVVGIGSVTMVNGTSRELADVDLQTSSTYTQADQNPTIPAAIAALPELHGYGLMTDLQSQMASDPNLAQMVSSFVGLASTSANFADLETATDLIMFQWAGVSNVDPASRGGLLDARRLEFLERYLGQPLTFINGNYGNLSDPGFVPALIDNLAFTTLENSLLARLLIQTFPLIGAEFRYDAVADVVAPATDLWTSITNLSLEVGPLAASNLGVWSQVAIVLGAYRADNQVSAAEFAEALNASGVVGLDVLENALS